MDEYFATLPVDRVGPEIFKRKEAFYEYLKTSGRLALYKRSYDLYYQAMKSGGRVYQTGEQGEFTNVDLADYRNLLLHLKVMTTNQQPVYEPKASNSDHKSLSQTILALGLLEYYLREKKLDRYSDMAMDYVLRYGDGWVELDWNATAGRDYVNNESGKVVKEGDLEAFAYSPLDVVIDHTRQSSLNHDWRITRRFENKYNIAAKYAPQPKDEKGEDRNAELRERILACSVEAEDRIFMFGRRWEEESDLIPVYTLHHRRSEAVPDGRLTRLVSADAILSDGPLPFKNMPLYRLAADDQDGTPFGYTVGFDIMALNDASNALMSTITTNAATFGVQNIIAPKGNGITISSIVDGLNLIEYDPAGGKPEALNLLSIPPELFKFLDQVRSYMEIIAGLSAVSRGQPEAGLKNASGAAMALVQSMAIQFNSGLQKSYAQLCSDMGTGIIEILHDFATTKRVATIAGKANRSLMREWTGKDLSSISRVVVNLGNPLSQTTAGRVSMAETLIAAKTADGSPMIESAQQYIQVLQTGRLEPLIEGKSSELLNIKSENERIANGEVPLAVMTDKHPLHIAEHKVVMDSPESREDPKVVGAWTQHIQRHFDVWRSTKPELLSVLGMQSILQPPPMVPAGNPPSPGMPGAAPLPEGDVAATLQPGPQPGPQPNLPAMPENPISGEKFSSDTGGMQ